MNLTLQQLESFDGLKRNPKAFKKFRDFLVEHVEYKKKQYEDTAKAALINSEARAQGLIAFGAYLESQQLLTWFIQIGADENGNRSSGTSSNASSGTASTGSIVDERASTGASTGASAAASAGIYPGAASE